MPWDNERRVHGKREPRGQLTWCELIAELAPLAGDEAAAAPGAAAMTAAASNSSSASARATRAMAIIGGARCDKHLGRKRLQEVVVVGFWC